MAERSRVVAEFKLSPDVLWFLLPSAAEAVQAPFSGGRVPAIVNSWTARLSGGVDVERPNLTDLRTAVEARPETLNHVSGDFYWADNSNRASIFINIWASFQPDHREHAGLEITGSSGERLNVVEVRNRATALLDRVRQLDPNATFSPGEITTTSTDDGTVEPVKTVTQPRPAEAHSEPAQTKRRFPRWLKNVFILVVIPVAVLVIGAAIVKALGLV